MHARFGLYSVALGFALTACGRDDVAAPHAPGDPPPVDGVPVGTPLTPGLVLSSPVMGESGPHSVVFVSARPGTARALAAAVALGMNSDTIAAMARDGGFDPLPVIGDEGDRIVVILRDSSGLRTAHELTVARSKPPRVVRTSPSAGRTDVPLNSVIEIVFSIPIDTASAAAGIHVLNGAQPIQGTISFTPDRLLARFAPSSLLASNTTYTLVIEPTVHDVLGSSLEAGATQSFTTGATGPNSASEGPGYIIGHRFPYLNYGEVLSPLRVGASVGAYAGAGVGLAVRWSSSAPGVLAVTERQPGFATITALAPGRAEVRAEIDGIVSVHDIEVYAEIPGELLSATRVYVHRFSELTLESMDGRTRTRLASATELPGEPTLCPVELRPTCYEVPYSFAISSTGRIAITRASDMGGVWIKDGPSGRLLRVNAAAEFEAAHGPAWSPDGSRLAYWIDFWSEARSELRVVEADGTSERVVLRQPMDTVMHPGCDPWCGRPVGGGSLVWHPDERRILMGSAGGTLQVPIDGSGATPYLLGYLPGPWLPGGQFQFVHEWRVPAESYLGRFPRTYRASADGVVDRATGFDTTYPLVAVSPDGRLMMDFAMLFTMDRTMSHNITSNYGYCCYDRAIGFAP